ncbi:hypothetical protein B0O80DRAFT_179142 [Mortierella sp. GBAus27b]|nr:hypothetical protein B0O80DRAFT_179142 [Mortierella sp. GBAus27b]
MTPGPDHNEPQVGNESSTCAICLSPYCGRVYLSPCFHSFCAPCLASWLLDISLQCPLCRTRPTKLHWDADTVLGTLNTITIPSASSASDTIQDGSSSSPRNLDQSSLPLKKASSWRITLRQVAAKAERDLEGRSRDHQSTADTSSGSSGTTRRKRDGSCENDQDIKRSRHGSRSTSRSRSRSRSTTPIDSYPHVYDSPNLYVDGQTSSSLLDPPLHESSLSESENLPPEPTMPHSTPTRRQVYALGMKLYPDQDYPLVDRIVATDMTRLGPFLERDLRVLTDVDPRPVDPIVLAYVTSLFTTHGGGHTDTRKRIATDHDRQRQAEWSLIEAGVAEWVTLTPGNGRTAIDLARQFVDEMRRVVKKKWGPGQWDSNVRYQA